MENVCNACGCPSGNLIMGVDKRGDIVEVYAACHERVVKNEVVHETVVRA